MDFEQTTFELMLKKMDNLTNDLKDFKKEVRDDIKKLDDKIIKLDTKVSGILKWTTGAVAVISFLFYFVKDWVLDLLKKII